MSRQKVLDSKERAEKLLEKADSILLQRSSSKIGGDDVQQRVYDLRAAIAVRETLRGELEQHRARRGRLTELHNELNVAEERLAEIKLDIHEHEMYISETQEKLRDIEGHMNILFADLQQMRDQLPRLLETEYVHTAKIDELVIEKQAAEDAVEQKKRHVREMEEHLNYIMNVGMSSQMWATDKEKADDDDNDDDAASVESGSLTSPPRSKKKGAHLPPSRRWSTVGKLKGEAIIYDEGELTPRTAEWGSRHRQQKTKYFWRVVYNAMKLGYLTNKIPFPPDAFVRMMAYIHGSDDAEQIKKLNEQLTAIKSVVDLQADTIHRLESQAKQRNEKGKDVERKLVALQQKYEKLRVEHAAVKVVISSMEDKSVEQLVHENRLYEIERRALYTKLYGSQRSRSVVALPTSTNAHRRATHAPGEDETPSHYVPPPIGESKFTRGGAADIIQSTVTSSKLSDSVKEAKSFVVERIKSFTSPPSGIGFLQHRLDEHVDDQRFFRKRMDALKLRHLSVQQKLEKTECIALHTFDAFARGRQAVEEELERYMVECQNKAKAIAVKHAEEKFRLENSVAQLTQNLSFTEQKLQTTTESLTASTVSCSQLADANAALTKQVEDMTQQISDFATYVEPETYAALATFRQTLSSFDAKSLVDYDISIGQILPMKSQRTFVSLVSKMLATFVESYTYISSLMHRLLGDCIRRTPVTIAVASSLGTTLTGQFESLVALATGVGRIGKDAIDNWDGYRRESMKSVATDVDDLPQPPPPVVIVEKEVFVKAIVDQTDATTQAGSGGIRGAAGTSSQAVQTTTVAKKDMVTETTIVLGKGAGDSGLGFVSTDTLKRMEDLLKAKIRDAENLKAASLQFVSRCKSQGRQLLQSCRGAEVQLMEREAIIADMARVVDDRDRERLELMAARRDVATATADALTRDFQNQIYFADGALGRLDTLFSEGAHPVSTAVCVDVIGLLAKKDAQSQTDVVQVVPTHRTVQTSSAATSPAEAYLPSPPMEWQRHSALTPQPLSSPARGPPPGRSFLNFLENMEKPAAMLPPKSPERASTPISPQRRFSAGVQANLSTSPTLPTFEPVELVAPPPVLVPVIDQELTSKAIAEMEASLERRLNDQYEQHRALLEDRVSAKEQDMVKHSETVDREALKLRLKVSSIQQEYEAVAASVTKFKALVRELENTRLQLASERDQRMKLERMVMLPVDAQAATSILLSTADRSVAFLDNDSPTNAGRDVVMPNKKAVSSIVGNANSVGFSGVMQGSNPSVSQAGAKSIRGRILSAASGADATNSAAAEAELKALKREIGQLSMQLQLETQRADALDAKLRDSYSPSNMTIGNAAPVVDQKAARAMKRAVSIAKLTGNRQREMVDLPSFSSSMNPQSPPPPSVPQDDIVASLTEKLNDAQMKLLASHDDLLTLRTRYSADTLALKEQLQQSANAVHQLEASLKKATADEQRCRVELERLKRNQSDAVAVLEFQAQEEEKKHRSALSKLETKFDAEKKACERAEKSLKEIKREADTLRVSTMDLQTRLDDERQLFMAKSRAASVIVSQLHCALVDMVLSLKMSLHLDDLVLADPSMGEAAVRLVKLMAYSTNYGDAKQHGNYVASDEFKEIREPLREVPIALIETSKFLGDCDTDLVRRVVSSVKASLGPEMTPPLAASDYPPPESPVALSPALIPASSTAPPDDVTLTLPHVERRQGNVKSVRPEIRISDRDTTFSLFPQRRPVATELGGTGTNKDMKDVPHEVLRSLAPMPAAAATLPRGPLMPLEGPTARTQLQDIVVSRSAVSDSVDHVARGNFPSRGPSRMAKNRPRVAKSME